MTTKLHHLLLLLLSAAAVADAQVPANETFKWVNEGELGDLSNEYQATYRTTLIGAHPWQLMFYNTTPNSFILAYRMGSVGSESSRFWIWEANRNRPVGDGATLTLGPDGNLVLAEADGTVAWSTGTANKGVVALRTYFDGNIVLVDKNEKAVWQSFDHPTDTILNGQSLTVSTVSKLVSRKSMVEDANGKYRWVMESKSLNFYVDATPSPIRYGGISFSKPLTNVTFVCQGRTLKLLTNTGTSYNLATSQKPCTYSFLRLEIDGNLVVQVYDDDADGNAWKQSYAYFSGAKACDMPDKCGDLGVCQSGRCASCPTAKGLVPWSSDCSPPSRAPCGKKPTYYKVVGVDHFVTKFSGGEGRVAAAECERRCSGDCNCLGYLYFGDVGKCWLTSVLGTFGKASSGSHVAYIKSA